MYLIGGAGYTGAIMSSSLVEWDPENEVAWCPEETHTYLRDIQGICHVLDKVSEQSIDAVTTAQHKCRAAKGIDTFFYRHVSDHRGRKMQADCGAKELLWK